MGGSVTLYGRLKSFWRANQRAVSRTVLVIALAIFTVGQFIPAVQGLLIARCCIDILTLLVVLALSATVSSAIDREGIAVSADQDQDTPECQRPFCKQTRCGERIARVQLGIDRAVAGRAQAPACADTPAHQASRRSRRASTGADNRTRSGLQEHYLRR